MQPVFGWTEHEQNGRDRLLRVSTRICASSQGIFVCREKGGIVEKLGEREEDKIGRVMGCGRLLPVFHVATGSILLPFIESSKPRKL